MPLYNVKNRGMKFAPLGSIRKGMQVPVLDKETGKPKKRNGEIVTRPKEMPHFIFHADATREEQIVGKLASEYGGTEIKSLNVLLAFPDPAQCWSCWMEAYNHNQLIARSDERILTYLFDTESNETLVKDGAVIMHSSAKNSPAALLVRDIPVGSPVPYVEDMVVGTSKSSNAPITFSAVGRLTVVIPELHKGDNPLPLGTWKVVTGGYWTDIPQIDSAMEMVKSICKITGCTANMIPLLLRRAEVESTYTKEDGSQGKRTSYPLVLEVRGDVISGLLETYNSSPFLNMLESHPAPALNAPAEAQEENYGDAPAEAIEADAVSAVPFMTYDAAKQVLIHVQRVEKFMGELNPQQLQYVVEHEDKYSFQQVDAARVLLADSGD